MKNPNKRILHLTIKAEWFGKIARGEKKFEYREMKPFWTKRLMAGKIQMRKFDEIHIRNGYTKDRPFMRLRWHGMGIKHYEGKDHYAIIVDDIIEILSKDFRCNFQTLGAKATLSAKPVTVHRYFEDKKWESLTDTMRTSGGYL